MYLKPDAYDGFSRTIAFAKLLNNRLQALMNDQTSFAELGPGLLRVFSGISAHTPVESDMFTALVRDLVLWLESQANPKLCTLAQTIVDLVGKSKLSDGTQLSASIVSSHSSWEAVRSLAANKLPPGSERYFPLVSMQYVLLQTFAVIAF